MFIYKKIDITESLGVSTCFTGDSLVYLEDGSKKRIDDVLVGERVLTYGDDFATVIDIERTIVGDRGLLSINGSDYFATTDHVFKSTGNAWISHDPESSKLRFPSYNHIIENGGFIKRMEIGDFIETINGLEEIKSIGVSGLNEYSYIPVYDLCLEFSSNHTYVVKDFVAHNCSPPTTTTTTTSTTTTTTTTTTTSSPTTTTTTTGSPGTTTTFPP